MNHISRAFEEHRNKSPKATFGPEILMLVTLYPGQPGDVWRYSEDTPTPGGQRLEILGSILKLLAPETGIMKPKGSKAYKEACISPPLWRKYRNRKESCPGSGHVSNSTSKENEEKGKTEKEFLPGPETAK